MHNGLSLLRFAVAAIFIYHSIPKLRDPKAMASGIGWMPGQVLALGIIEFMCSLGLIGGLAVKFSAFILSIVMLGALYHKIKKWHVPFMSHTSTGWELDFMILAALLTIYNRF